MSTVQTTYGKMSDNVKTTRPTVESDAFMEGGAFKITFDDDERAKDVAMELARLLGCSPDDFGYGAKEGRPVPISIEGGDHRVCPHGRTPQAAIPIATWHHSRLSMGFEH